MRLGDQLPARKKLLAVSVGINLILLGLIVVLMMRMQNLRRASVPPELPEVEAAALSKVHAFGSILDDHGWKVRWNTPERYERNGVIRLQRGGFYSEYPDKEGEPVQVGLDALTFGPEVALPGTDPFPLEKWRDLHPLRAFGADDDLAWEVVVSGRTYLVFYQYRPEFSSDLAASFASFLEGDGLERAEFRRQLAEAYQAKKRTLAAIKTIQETLLGAGLYEGEIDGMNGWRTKHAVQRFLRRQGFYSGDIDGVFGTRTLKALFAFRTQAGLDRSDAMDPELAEAIVKALAASGPAAGASDTGVPGSADPS